MSGQSNPTVVKKRNANRITAAICVGVFSAMVGVSFAAVPLYNMFCRITGYGGTTQRVEQYSDRVLEKRMKIRFDANTSSGIPWDFKPALREIELRIGETAKIHYTAHNFFGEPATGRATFNVTPQSAGAYFNKVECFCFTDTTLQPGETIEMPVVFYIDPDIVEVPELKNIETITLSYTLFPSGTEKPVAARGGETAATEKFGG